MVQENLELHQEKASESQDWSLNIEAVSNGYILRGLSDSGMQYKRVIEDFPDDELKSHEALLWDVMEYFGLIGSKHDKERLQIVRKKNK